MTVSLSLSAPSMSHGASPLPGRPREGGTASLEGELAKCETQLADWTHCVSAKTPEGKAKIAEIRAKIDDIKASMATSTRSPSLPSPSGTFVDTHA